MQRQKFMIRRLEQGLRVSYTTYKYHHNRPIGREYLQSFRPLHYLEGHGDLVSRFKIGMFWAITWLIGIINLLTKSP